LINETYQRYAICERDAGYTPIVCDAERREVRWFFHFGNALLMFAFRKWRDLQGFKHLSSWLLRTFKCILGCPLSTEPPNLWPIANRGFSEPAPRIVQTRVSMLGCGTRSQWRVYLPASERCCKAVFGQLSPTIGTVQSSRRAAAYLNHPVHRRTACAITRMDAQPSVLGDG